MVLPLLILASQSDPSPGRQDVPAPTASSVGWRGMLPDPGERRDDARLGCPRPVDRPDRSTVVRTPTTTGRGQGEKVGANSSLATTGRSPVEPCPAPEPTRPGQPNIR